jgi:nucleoside-diphosphate-sugar epimerase
VRGLLKRGAIVRSLDNNSRGAAAKLSDLADQIELREGDIRDARTVREAVQGMDAVCHLAYVNGTEFFYQKPELILEVAVKGMMNVLDACVAENVRELHLASSSEVYQNAAQVPTAEDVPLVVPNPLNPRYSYGGGKIISELLALNYGRSLLDRVIVFRPHNVYGPDMGSEHVIPQFALRMKQACAETAGPVDFPIQGTGQETRAFIYIDDFVEGVLKIMEEGETQNIYHIGSDEEIPVAQIAELVGQCFDREIRIIPGPLQPGSPSRRCPDVSKLRALGFSSSTSLPEGIAKTVAWYRQNR